MAYAKSITCKILSADMTNLISRAEQAAAFAKEFFSIAPEKAQRAEIDTTAFDELKERLEEADVPVQWGRGLGAIPMHTKVCDIIPYDYFFIALTEITEMVAINDITSHC